MMTLSQKIEQLKAMPLSVRQGFYLRISALRFKSNASDHILCRKYLGMPRMLNGRIQRDMLLAKFFDESEVLHDSDKHAVASLFRLRSSLMRELEDQIDAYYNRESEGWTAFIKEISATK